VGETEHLASLIKVGIEHAGFALVDILQPCVSFNRLNTFIYYKERVCKLGDDYDPADWNAAMQKSMEWGHKIPIGVIYRNERPAFEERLGLSRSAPLCEWETDKAVLREVMNSYL